MHKALATLLSVLAVGAAQAADLPAKAPLRAQAPAAAPYGPLYIITAVGAGVSGNQNDLTIPGIVVQGASPKQWPTGFLATVGAGVEAVTPIGKAQFELLANYDFSAASFGCMPTVGCLGRNRNGLLFQEMVYYSPIAAPLSFTGWQWAQTVGFYGGAGAAEKQLNVCLSNLVTPGEVCDNAWLTGLDAGAKMEIPITSTVKARITYDYLHYDHRIVHDMTPVFTSGFTAQDEHLLRAGLDFHF